MSSRRIRSRLLPLAVAAGVALTGFSGVASASTPDDTGAAAATAPEATGTLRLAYAGPIDSLDPHLSTVPVSPAYQYPIYDRLFQLTTDGVVPMLAADSSFSDDGSTFTVHLIPGAVFHDGTPVTAAAVKASIERGQSIEGSTVAAQLAGITAVTAVDDATVELTLDGVGAELPAILSTNVGAILNPAVIDDPSADLDTAPPPGAGSGPYVVTESEPNVATTYAAAPEYWNADLARFAEMTVSFVAQSASRLAGLQAGDFDMIQITADIFDQAKGEAAGGAYDMFETVGATRDLLLNTESGDLADIDVRHAIDLAINREDLGVIQPCMPNNQLYPDDSWAANPDISHPYDPDAARALIDALGGASFEMAVASGSSYEPFATVIQSQLAEVGIDMQLKLVEQSQTNQMFSAGEVASVITTISPQGDPQLTLDRYFLGGVGIARGDLLDELGAIVEPAGDPSLSQDERGAIFSDAFGFIADNFMYIPTCASMQGWASTMPVAGIEGALAVPGVPDMSMVSPGTE